MKIDPQVKKEAKKVAQELGLSLTDLVTGSLKEIIRTKEVHFSVNEKPLVPTEYLKRSLAESEREIQEGYVSPAFDEPEDAIKWLTDPEARYQDGKKVRTE